MWFFDSSRIRIARESRDLSQVQLAAKLEMSAQQLSQWEIGAVKPGQDSLMNICNMLNINPKFFFTKTVPNVHSETERVE